MGSVRTDLEELVNPFGQPWRAKGPPNEHVPIATSTMYGLYNSIDGLAPRLRKSDSGEFELHVEDAEAHFLRNAGSRFHYDESVTHLKMDMPEFRAVRKRYESLGISKTFIGYVFVNMFDSHIFSHKQLKEEWFLHRRGEPVAPESRVFMREKSQLRRDGLLLNTASEEYAEFAGKTIVEAMLRNGIDAILIDYIGRPLPVGYNGIRDQLPEYFLDSYREGQRLILKTIADKAHERGLLVFFNGIGVGGGLYNTSYADMLRLISVCDGAFWEQPFRDELRDVRPTDPDAYYLRLREFFNLSVNTGKYIIIKQGTYRFTGDENAVQGWKARFGMTTRERERHLARYLLAFYLLYSCGEVTPMIYTHPVQVWDIYSSEAFFKDWDVRIGAAVESDVRQEKHVYSRRFENGLVVVNNSDHHFELKLERPRMSLDSEVVDTARLARKSGGIYLDL